MNEPAERLLKQDLFGTITLRRNGDDIAGAQVVRNMAAARWWLRPLAGHLARREARALRRLEALPDVPRCLYADRQRLVREWIEAQPMQVAQPRDARYFREALRLVRRLHAARVVHNDLAKEPNWLVTPDGLPALVDFQLAWTARRRGRLFRALAHDDLRHLLKHKRSYRAESLTAREKRILETRSLLNRIWMRTAKPVYTFLTRRVFGWSDREGAGDRSFRR